MKLKFFLLKRILWSIKKKYIRNKSVNFEKQNFDKLIQIFSNKQYNLKIQFKKQSVQGSNFNPDKKYSIISWFIPGH